MINSQTSNQIQNSNAQKKFDLENRTRDFGINCISFCKKIQLNPLSTPIVTQFIRSSTSVGANYMEANGADSKKDFHAKISICKKESKETLHWLAMIEQLYPYYSSTIKDLWNEAHELSLIFGAINRN